MAKKKQNPDAKAVAITKRLEALQAKRDVWESHWQECADYVAPRKADVTKHRTDGDKRTELRFDATAQHAAELLAASLHGMLTNPATPWFSLRFRDAGLDTDDEAREWIEGITNVMYGAFNRSNFAEAIHELYHDLVVFGTGVLFIEQDPEGGIRFATRHIGECFVSEDGWGRVDTVYRKFTMPARAAAERFGYENLPQSMQKKLEKDAYEPTTIVHAVMPRDEENRAAYKLDAENKPYASCYIDPEEKVLLSESGFDEFPYMVPRWKKSSYEIGYGRSPTMTALPDIKMLNKMSEVTIRAAQKQIDPPLMLPDDGFMLPIRTVPGGLNFYRAGTRDRIEPLQIGANNPLGLQTEEQRRQAIRSAFYVDQLILGQGPQMTATEVVQRTEEKMRLLGPVLGRLQAELLQPLIGRVFALMTRQKVFAPAPEFMTGMELDIEYVSPLAKAQRAADAQSGAQLFELLAPIAQIDQSILDYVDRAGLAKFMIRALGIPAEMVRGERDVAQLREQRAEQQAQAQQMAEVSQVAEAAGNAAPALRAIDETEILGSLQAG